MSNKQYEILALTLRYWFVLLITYIFAQCVAKTIRGIFPRKPVRRTTGNIPFILVLLSLTAFGLLSMQEPNSINIDTALMGVLVSAIVLFQFYLLYYIFPGLDEVLLLTVDTLAILGFVMLQRLTPEMAIRQVEWFAAGSIAMVIVIVIIPRLKGLGRLNYLLMIVSPVVLFLVAFFGKESGGATSRIPLGPFSIHPAEFVKLVLIIVLAFSLNERKTFRQKLPVFLFSAASVLGVVLQKDLGSALQYFIVFLLVYYISTNDWFLTAVAAGAGAVASIFSYKIFSHVRVRIEAWKNPWADVGGKGFQVAQSLMAMGSGGLIGLGLGLGSPYVIPASRTDFIFAAICEEFGIMVGGMIIGFYAIIIIRSMQKAFQAEQPSDMLLACGSAISLGIQAFIIIGGVVKMIPLTGITLPFVSYGGSSMIVSLCIQGIIQGVSIKNERLIHKAEADPEQQTYEFIAEEGEEQP